MATTPDPDIKLPHAKPYPLLASAPNRDSMGDHSESRSVITASALIGCLPGFDSAGAIKLSAEKLKLCHADAVGFATAAFLAEILSRHVDQNVKRDADNGPDGTREEEWRILYDFLLMAINSASLPPDGLRHVVELCDYPHVLNELVSACIRHLKLNVDEEVGSSEPCHFPETDWSAGLATRTATLSTLDTGRALSFLKTLCWTKPRLPVSIVHELTCRLVRLVLFSSKSLSNNAFGALLAVLPKISTGSHVRPALGERDQMPSLHNLLWDSVRHLTNDPKKDYCRTSGFLLWLRMIKLQREYFVASKIFESDEYWHMLQSGLMDESNERRKASLAILRNSLPCLNGNVNTPCFKFDYEDRALYLAEYSRFCVLYETIVLTRYLNQVQECINDLRKLSAPESKVHETWVVALLTAALSHGMQDSIRRVFGPWVLQFGVDTISTASTLVDRFLTQGLLPWATLGYLFTSSIDVNFQRRPICVHGEHLSSFLAQLLLSLPNVWSMELAYKVILAFVEAHGGYMLPFARAYLLHGLCKGLKLRDAKLEKIDVDVIVKLASATNFPEISRDFMTCQLAELVTLAPLELRDSKSVKALIGQANLIATSSELDAPSDFAHVQRLRAAATTFSPLSREVDALDETHRFDPGDYVQHVLVFLDISRNRCLTGAGLEAATFLMLRALEASSARKIQSHQLKKLLEAIWEEAEIQDYPKTVLMRLPSICLHRIVLASCPSDPDLRDLVNVIILKLQEFGENRIYLFPPLAESIRHACLFIPQAQPLQLTHVINRYANNPPSSKVEFQLEAVMAQKLSESVPSKSYSFYYGHSEGYGHACVFDCLNRLPMTPGWLEFGARVLDDLLRAWVEQKQPVPIYSKWKKTTQLQAILILTERCIAPDSLPSTVDDYLAKFFDVLSVEPMPRFRYLLEWIIVRLYMKFPTRRKDILQILSKLGIANPKHCVSVMKISLMLARLPDASEDFAVELCTQLVCLAASPKIAIRHEAQWTLPSLWDCALQRNWESITENPAFSRLNAQIRALDSYQIPPAGRLHESFDPQTDHTLVNLFEGHYLRINPEEENRTSRDDFLDVWRNSQEHNPLHTGIMDEATIPLGDVKAESVEVHDDGKTKHNQDERGLGEDSSIPLQIKAAQMNDELSRDTSLASPGNASGAKDVILVASLVDSAYNLGGLSRVAEIFGAKSMQVKSLDVVKSKEFSSVAVSSQFWLSIEELRLDSISQYLVERKLNGYTIVGIEQTDSSKVLGDDAWRLPKKVVFVLGSEKEGIAANLLADMDVCVEVRQAGVTRSMNVQTAAAVALYEYSRQYP